jgi:superfamily II DNA or RNA helicase
LLFGHSTFYAVVSFDLGLDVQREVMEAVIALLTWQKMGPPRVVIADIHYCWDLIMEISAVIDNRIRLPGFALPEDMSNEIIGDLTIYDEDDDLILDMWEEDDGDLVVPRGYAFRLAELIEEHEIDVEWIDRRAKGKGFPWGKPLPLDPEQKRIVEWVLEAEQGIVKAPTGMGKTVTCLEIVRIVPGDAIVIVNTKEIAKQWMDRAVEYLGEDFPTELVGDGKFNIADSGLTVALQGTLWSRREKLQEEGFFDRFSLCMLDECHHATARTFNDVFDRFSSKIRIGVSATPEKTGIFDLAEVVIGPIIVEVDEEDVDRITKPKIEVIETKLGRVEEKKGFKKGARKKKRINYESELKKLLASEDRLMLVVNEIMRNQQLHRNLVISKRIEHLENVYDALVIEGYPEDQLVAMVGAHSIDERSAAIAAVEEGPCVLLTTLADEALDAPLLEVLHLIWPTANVELLLQQIGRVRRNHAEKKKSLVIDYRDRQVPCFERQYMNRRHGCYDARCFTVVKRDKKDVHRRKL